MTPKRYFITPWANHLRMLAENTYKYNIYILFIFVVQSDIIEM